MKKIILLLLISGNLFSQDKKISQLTPLPSVNGSELIPVARSGANYYMTTSQLPAYLGGSFWKTGLNTYGTTGTFGTSDANRIDFYTNNLIRGRLTSGGSWQLGATFPSISISSPLISIGSGTTSATYAFGVYDGGLANNYFALRNDSRMIYKDGNQGAGKILQSDANGVSTWVSPSWLSTSYSVAATSASSPLSLTTNTLFLNYGTGLALSSGSLITSAIPNSALSNSTFTINGTGMALGTSSTITADASTLTGTTLNSTVVSSSLTSVGTLTAGVVPTSLFSGTVSIANGGTNNNSFTTNGINYYDGTKITNSSKFKWQADSAFLKFQENTNTGWHIYTRPQVTASLNIPVGVFRPNSNNQVMALDITPHGTPSDYAGQGLAWLDICDTDELVDEANLGSLRLGIWSTKTEIGSRKFGTGTLKPLNFTMDGITSFSISTSGNLGFASTTAISGGLNTSVNNGVLFANSSGTWTTSSLLQFDNVTWLTPAYNTNAQAGVLTSNSSAGGAAQATHITGNGTHNTQCGIFGTGWTNSGLRLADMGYLYTSGAGGLLIGTSSGTGSIYFCRGGVAGSNEWMRMDANGLSVLTRTTSTAFIDIAGGTASLPQLRLNASTDYTGGLDGTIWNETTTHKLKTTLNGTVYQIGTVLTATATLDFSSTSSQSSSDLTITVTGSAAGDAVSIGVPNGSVLSNSSFSAWVSASNTVTIRFNNYSSGSQDPASGTFKVTVNKN